MIHSLMPAGFQRKLRMKKPIPNGQIQYTSAGTFLWTCPPNVTAVSVALVGAGGSGKVSAGNTGAGGNVRYVNDVPVIPGQTYTITLPQVDYGTASARNTTSAFGYTAASPLGGNVQGGNGTAGWSSRYSDLESGGNVGFIPAGRAGQGINLKTFAPTSPTGTFSRHGGACGGGGGFWRDRENAGQGGPAGVRIIWGENRAFPSTNIGDL